MATPGHSPSLTPPPFRHWKTLLYSGILAVSGVSGGALTTHYIPSPPPAIAETQPAIEAQLDQMTIEIRALRKTQLEQNYKFDNLEQRLDKLERVQLSRQK